MILVKVAWRGPREDKAGWEDRLECGHSVLFDGAYVERRRCRECEALGDQLSLLEVPVETPQLVLTMPTSRARK